LAAAGYLLLNLTNRSEKIAEAGKSAQPLFQEYVRSIEKISTHLKETPGSDRDSLERYALEGKLLIEDQEKKISDLQTQIGQTNISELETYMSILNEYIQASEKILSLEKSNIEQSDFYREPIGRYKDIMVNVSGAGTYMYSDPDKYNALIKTAVADEKNIISDLKKYQPNDTFAEYHSLLIRSMEEEIKFLEGLLTAVNRRDTNAIAAAMQQFAQTSQNMAIDMNRIVDETDKKIKDYENDLEVLKDKAEDEYSSLRQTYQF